MLDPYQVNIPPKMKECGHRHDQLGFTMLTPEAGLAPSFDDPVALLLACHDKVRRFAGLSLRLDQHLVQRGLDDEARQAASNILRYFDVAAPLHHADEEEDLFPALRQLGDAAVTAALDALEAEHHELGRLWREVRPWLEAVAQQGSPVRPAALSEFAQRYTAHADREERDVYGAAKRLDQDVLHALGRRMSQRRRLPV